MGTDRSTVVMDARKFARHINNGAAAKLKFFEEAVQRMGAQVNKNLRLTSLDSTSLMFEDVEKNDYFIADIKKATRGKVDLDNIRQISIVESEKPDQFQKNCRDLVEHICDDNFKMAEKVFGRIESQRFNSRVIPESGWITLRDGVARKVQSNNQIVAENHVEKIVKLVSEAMEDQVSLQEGRIVRGSLSDGTTQLTIPINEYTRRRIVAHKMRHIAENAYRSGSFKEFVFKIGSSLCESDMKSSCQLAAKFLREAQEFSLLTRKQTLSLVENAFAARGEFNPFLARDVAEVLYETNIAVNKDLIVEAWTKAAQKAENPSLLRNINILAESDNFGKDHDEFLNIVFNEDLDVQQARAKAYRTTLKIIAGILPELEDEDDTASVDELNELIQRLSGGEADTDAVLQAEELLASISDSLIDNIQSLEGYDQEPGEEEGTADDDDENGELVPLPEVGEGGEEEEDSLEAPEGEGEEAGMMPPMAPEEEMPPLSADAEHPGASRKINTLNLGGLLEDVEEWRLNADSYLVEHGYESCSSTLDAYVKRCMEIGPQANVIREYFEDMRGSLLESNGQKILSDLELSEDPYSDLLAVALNGPTKIIGSSNKSDPEMDPDFVGRSISEGKIDRDYVHLNEDAYPQARVPNGVSAASDDLSMDELQGGGGVVPKSTKKSDGRSAGGEAGGWDQKQRGTGVQNKGLKPSDGRSGHHSTSGSAGGDLRMDDQQSGGVQPKGLHSSDGRKGGVGASSTPAESTVATSGGATNKTDLSMGSDHQGKSKKGSVTGGGLQNGNGAAGDGAKSTGKYEASGGPTAVALRMDDLQGSDGIEDKGMSGDHPGDSKTDTKPAPKGGDMSKDQGGDTVTKHNKGVSEDFSPENIAALISEMEGGVCDGGCPEEGACPESCGCPKSCKCHKAVSEGELPEHLKKFQKGKSGDSDSDDSDDSDDSSDSDDSDGGNPFGKKDDDDDDDDDIAESQRKGPTKRRKRGLKRQSIEDEDTKNESSEHEGENLVEMDDMLGDDMGEAGGDDENIVVVAGKPNEVMSKLQDVLADLAGDGEGMEDADVTGDELDMDAMGDDQEDEGMDGLDSDLEDDDNSIESALNSDPDDPELG